MLNVKVKHLRAVLNSSNISTNTCKEKRDLVDLFIRNKDKFKNSTNPPEGSTSPSTSNTHSSTTTTSANSSATNNYNFDTTSNTSQRPSPLINNTLNSLINNFQGFVSSNLGSVFNTEPVPCPAPPNRTNNQSNPNASSSSSSSTSSQNFNSIFDMLGNQIPNVFSHFTQNAETNDQPTQSGPSFQSENSQSDSQNDNNRSKNNSDVKRRASLSDLKSIQDIDDLTNKQIKEILTRNFVDYKGCFERSELVDKLRRLFVSHYKNKLREQEINNPTKTSDNKVNSDESEICKICMESIMDCVILDCGHMCSCIKCGKQLAECPICRQNVVKVVRVFKS